MGGLESVHVDPLLRRISVFLAWFTFMLSSLIEIVALSFLISLFLAHTLSFSHVFGTRRSEIRLVFPDTPRAYRSKSGDPAVQGDGSSDNCKDRPGPACSQGWEYGGVEVWGDVVREEHEAM